MKKIYAGLLIIIAFFNYAAAQDTLKPFLKTYKVAVFAPLYLDSVFTVGNDFRYSKNFPRFVVPGLDFVQGAQIALDSMPLPNGNLDVHFFDSKSESKSIGTLISSKQLDSFDVMIGTVKDEEYTQLASFASSKKIPFISATYPNDGGVTNNPYLVIVNSTLRAHCEAIFSYILQNHSTDKIFLLRKPGTQEDKVAGYFSTINKPDGKPLLNIQTINIDSNFNLLKAKLDSNRNNIIIGGSLDEDFATDLAAVAAGVRKKYDITLIGMPNWDGFKSFGKKNLADFPIFFTSPYYNYKWDNYSKMIQNIYLKKYKGKPSDYCYKGFETIFIFSRLFTRYPDDFMNHLNDYAYKVFSEYNFRPVSLNKDPNSIDYYENKHLYFLKFQNGAVTKAW